MSKITLAPNASGTGTLTVAAPNTNSDYTLTLPANTGTILTSASSITQNAGPAIHVYSSTGATLTNSTWTKIILDSEVYDTDSCFNTSTYRFTPNVAGYYLVNLLVKSNWSGSQWATFQTAVYKNGSRYSLSTAQQSTGVTSYPTLVNTTLIYCNGSSDYLEGYVYSDGGTNPTYQSNSDTTYMTACLIRAA